MSKFKFAILLLSSSLLLVAGQSAAYYKRDGRKTYKLSRSDEEQLAKQEAARYVELLKQGIDEVSNTEESNALRNYRLRNKKMKGFWRKKEVSLASVLFPGVYPQEYEQLEDIVMYANRVESRKTQIPFEFYDLPVCPPTILEFKRVRKNLGARLLGHDDNPPAPFSLKVKQNKRCTPICLVSLGGKKLRWTTKLIERKYRVHLTLDQLPVLMRSKELNYAVRGYPVGFKAPASYTGLKNDEYYLYNHLRFTVTYREDPENFDGVRITGFDVHPVSIQHDVQRDEVTAFTKISTCNHDDAPDVVNNPNTYLPLRTSMTGDYAKILYSYEVKWVASDLPWADRWDVYLLEWPDDDIRFFEVVNNLMIVLVLTGATAIIIIRTLRKDIASFIAMQTVEESQDETGWKVVRGDVFRPPSTWPMMLSVAVGTGAQLGCTSFFGIVCFVHKLIDPMNKGQALTTILVLYLFSGSVAGYVSARLYKFCDAKACDATPRTMNTIYTAIALPGSVATIFAVLNTFLRYSAVDLTGSDESIFELFLFIAVFEVLSSLALILLVALWCCVSIPFVFVGSYFGHRADKIQVPVKTDLIARVVPDNLPWYVNPRITVALGGVLPFGSVLSELTYVMSALWLNQPYFVMGFLLVVLLMLTATCAQVAIATTYLQLRSEDHRWWWKSFCNCASAGVYLLLYSIWFLFSRLDLVGVVPVVVYMTYMIIISCCFGLFCGSVGVLASFWFNRIIYGAV